jgi:hypothetical protein
MRISIATIAVLTGIAIFGATHSPVLTTTSVHQPCAPIVQTSELAQPSDICVTADNEVTWGEWFSGESRSTQFHFLDFFELMFGDDKERDYSGGDYASPKLRY